MNISIVYPQKTTCGLQGLGRVFGTCGCVGPFLPAVSLENTRIHCTGATWSSVQTAARAFPGAD